MAFFSGKSDLSSSFKQTDSSSSGTTKSDKSSKREKIHRVRTFSFSMNFDGESPLTRSSHKQKRVNSNNSSHVSSTDSEFLPLSPRSMTSIYSQLASPQFPVSQLVLYDLSTFLESLGVHDVAETIAGLVLLQLLHIALFTNVLCAFFFFCSCYSDLNSFLFSCFAVVTLRYLFFFFFSCFFYILFNAECLFFFRFSVFSHLPSLTVRKPS
jgi:hypothetical protein